MKLYENLGFVRDKRLFRYYLNGVDALRLKLWLRWETDIKEHLPAMQTRPLHAMQFVQNCFAGGFSDFHAALTCQCLIWVSHNICCTLAWRIPSELKEIVLNLKSSFGTNKMCQSIAKICLFIWKVCWHYLHSGNFIAEPGCGTWVLFLKKSQCRL